VFLSFLLPLFSLSFATEALGSERESRSLVWLLSRPLPRGANETRRQFEENQVMLHLREIEQTILQNGRVDGPELAALRQQLYAGGKIERPEADFLVELHKRVQHRTPAFEQFFYQAIKDHILARGRIDAEEAAWLRQMLFADGKIDAFLGTTPQPQMLRARKIGHSILDTKIDRPWSNYYCCTLAGSGDYASKYPVATKRVLRAILKSIDLCGSAPQAMARQLVDRGLADNYELLGQSLTAIGFDRWRDFDTDDAIRFYTLRMREVGMSKADPINIIADGTNWQFLNEIKRELKT
jgi:hypothetical protein